MNYNIILFIIMYIPVFVFDVVFCFCYCDDVRGDLVISPIPDDIFHTVNILYKKYICS